MRKESWVASGERIFGIWYRKVKFKILTWKKNVEDAYLDGTNRWKMVSDDRSEASEAEMIEVYLEDSEDEEEDIYIVVNDEVVTAQAEKGKLAEE